MKHCMPVSLHELEIEIDMNKSTLYARLRMLVSTGVVEQIYEEKDKIGRPATYFKLSQDYKKGIEDNFEETGQKPVQVTS